MKYLLFTDGHLSVLKKAVRAELPNVGSSHISEALAAALGFQKHASLLTEMDRVAWNPPYLKLEDDRFCEKLEQLGHDGYQYFSFEDLDF